MYVVVLNLCYSMARTNTNNVHNTAKNNNAVASVPQATVVVRSNTPATASAINQTAHSNYNNCDVLRNATNAASSNQIKNNAMNGPKQLPQIVNGAKHNHLDNHYDSVKVCTYLRFYRRVIQLLPLLLSCE